MNESMTVRSSTAPAKLRARLNDFWHWWISELRVLVPAGVTGWVVGDVAVTDVMVDGTDIHLMRIESGKPIVFATIAAGDATTDPGLRELRAKGNDRVRVLLNVDQVLLKVITLPAATEENLREVMGFELDRHTPFMASQAYYDVRLLRRDTPRETIEVLLAVAARSVVDPLLATLRQAGLSIDAITVVDSDAAGQTIALLPARDKPTRKWGNLLRINLALLVLALLLGLLALLLPVWQKRELVIALNPLVTKANAEYEVSQRIYDEYTKLVSEYNYITGKKQGMHPSLAILEELTRIFPDTASVQSLDLKSSGKTRDVTLIGEAQAASKIIEVLEQSALFQNASQRSQTRPGSQGRNEWFHIATELKPKALPAPSALDEKPAAAIELPASPPASALPPTTPPTTSPTTLPAALEPAAPAPKSAPGVTQPAGALPAKAEIPTATVTVVTPAKPVALPPAAANRKQP